MIHSALTFYLLANQNINNIAANKIYPKYAPDGITLPYIVVEFINGDDTMSLSHAKQYSSARIRLVIASTDLSTIYQLRDEIKTTMMATDVVINNTVLMGAFLESENDGLSGDAEYLYLDYKVIYKES